MDDRIEDERSIYVAGHGPTTIKYRLYDTGQDQPQVLIVWCPEVRAKGWRLVDRPECIGRIARDLHRTEELSMDCVRIVEALHPDEFAAIEIDVPEPEGRPVLGTYFQVDRARVERWIGGTLAPIDLPGT
jgi:hypothetical protein